MALKKCPDCASMISKSALACPTCGRATVLDSNMTAFGWIVLVTGIIAGIVALSSLSGCSLDSGGLLTPVPYTTSDAGGQDTLLNPDASADASKADASPDSVAPGDASPTGMKCGGPSKILCPDKFFCDLPAWICDGDLGIEGVCVPQPNIADCPRPAPVPAYCDNVVCLCRPGYAGTGQAANDCDRIAIGAYKFHDGPCLPTPDCPAFCGGTSNIACPSGFYCEKSTEGCGLSYRKGSCVKQPEAKDCPPPSCIGHVCGCNGVTYGNDCLRILAGVQKDLPTGPCAGAPPC